jgi:hypothetical protein
MKNTCILLFLLLPFFLLAQETEQKEAPSKNETKASDSFTGTGNSDVFLANLTAKTPAGSMLAFDNRYEGVKGTPFFFDNWSLGSLVYDNHVFDKELEYRYDVIKNDLHIKFRSGEVRIPDNVHILQFTLKDATGKSHFFDHALISGQKNDQFYEVLYAGKQCQLVKLMKKELRKADYKGAYSSDQRSDEFITSTKYFLRTTANGNYLPVKIKRKFLISAFPEYETQLETLLDTKEYKHFEEDTFAKALKHIETEWLK